MTCNHVMSDFVGVDNNKKGKWSRFLRMVYRNDFIFFAIDQHDNVDRVLTLDLIRKSWHLQLRVGGLQWSVASFYSESSSVNVDLSLSQCVYCRN